MNRLYAIFSEMDLSIIMVLGLLTISVSISYMSLIIFPAAAIQMVLKLKG